MLARRHLLFLAQRIQWLAYYEPWADFFWQRGLDTGEIAHSPCGRLTKLLAMLGRSQPGRNSD